MNETRKKVVLRRAVQLVACAVGLQFAGCGRSTGPGREVRYEELVARLTDRDALARLDTPSARLISSFDRKGGNDDFNNPLRKGPKGWVVLADLKGPGYISRFWTTGEDGGKHPLRFYFDGERSPRIDTTLDEFCGGKAPFLSPLAAYEPFCWYSWMPIPYRKRLVVMTAESGTKPDGNPKIFYQICYNTLAAGETVESLPSELGASDREALNKARERLLASYYPNLSALELSRQRPDAQHSTATIESEGRLDGTNGRMSTNVVIQSGQKSELLTIRGSAVLREFVVQLDLAGLASTVEKESLMRDLILRMFWDGSKEPSVEVPLGDFFGSVWKRRQFESFYFGMSNGVYRSRFPMPFQSAARIEVENQSKYNVPVTVELRAETMATWTNAWGYFHVGWQRSEPERVGQPHRILKAQGKGKFVGCILSACSLDKSWWILEGDETIRVDEETFPGWHGTGLEDYFNGGWYFGSAIVRPFHGLISKVHFKTVQYRIHQVDPVAFASSCDVLIERGDQNVSHGYMESVAFYYLAAPGKADSILGDRRFRTPPDDPQLVPATIMTEINDLERLGDFLGASNFVAACLEKMPDHPYAPVLTLRQLMYAERDLGFEAVKPRYEEFARVTTNALARKEAEDWLWFKANSSNALLGAYCNTATSIFLDGRVVGKSGDLQRMQVFRVQIAQGRHALALEAVNRSYPRWVQAVLRTHHGDVATSREWKYAVGPQNKWSTVDYDDSMWRVLGGVEFGKGPPEEPYVWLEPQAFVGMQSAARGLWTNEENPDPKAVIVFRTSFNLL